MPKKIKKKLLVYCAFLFILLSCIRTGITYKRNQQDALFEATLVLFNTSAMAILLRRSQEERGNNSQIKNNN